MSAKKAKRLRRAVRKEASKISIEALKQFFEFSKGQGLWNRVKFCFKILFKQL